MRKILFWPQLTIVPDCLGLALCHTLSHLFVTFCCTHLSHIVVLDCCTWLSRSVVLVCHTCFGLLYLEQGGSRHFGAIVAIGKLRLVTTKSRFSLIYRVTKIVGMPPPLLGSCVKGEKAKVVGIAPLVILQQKLKQFLDLD